jgi:hypothetical protein
MPHALLATSHDAWWWTSRWKPTPSLLFITKSSSTIFPPGVQPLRSGCWKGTCLIIILSRSSHFTFCRSLSPVSFTPCITSPHTFANTALISITLTIKECIPTSSSMSSLVFYKPLVFYKTKQRLWKPPLKVKHRPGPQTTSILMRATQAKAAIGRVLPATHMPPPPPTYGRR